MALRAPMVLRAPSMALKGIRYFDFQTRKTTQVGTIRQDVPRSFAGMSATRDGRWLLITQTDRADSDLMLIENFQ